MEAGQQQSLSPEASLGEREAWAALALAEQMRVYSMALGEESKFARQLDRAGPRLRRQAQVRLGDRLSPALRVLPALAALPFL